VATPIGHEPDPAVSKRAEEVAARSEGRVVVTNLVSEAAIGAHVLYTDVWTSMGQEGSEDSRKSAFERYQVNDEVVDMADGDAIVMHCLPAHRGEEIAEDVIDGERSVVWDQAENRLHVQKALLRELVAG
jgi:ornithine carbamoyltransferase